MLLNIATKIAAKGNIKLSEMLFIVLITLVLFIIITIFTKNVKKIDQKVKTRTVYLISFIVLLIVCGVLSKFGINIMYSAFLVGYMVKGIFGTKKNMKTNMEYLEHFVFSFFVPIYFALVGIQLNVIHDFSFIRFCLFFSIAFGLEFIGTWIMLLFTKLSRNMRINFAITMNARGGPGIVLATVAYASNIINLEFFTVLILTTMITKKITSYYLRYKQRKNSKIFNKL